MTDTNLLHSYYQGITQQIRGEVDFINSLFDHQGVKGEGNETVLRDLIRRFIPGRYGVGTGVVIDRNGKPSRQCDIVIFDEQLYPSLLALGTVHMFPVDLVYATIEVKTTLDKREAGKAIENVRSVRSLDYIRDTFEVLDTHQGKAAKGEITPSPPLGIVFAYNSKARTFATFTKWFKPPHDADRGLYPTLVACLDQGIVRFEDITHQPSSRLRGLAFPLLDPETEKPICCLKHADADGLPYPVTKVKGHWHLIDQATTLLNFLLLLTETLSLKRHNPELRFTERYLPPSLRTRFTLDL